eukprot:CAMPEP_0194030996 /NCGR_PEP_ID=MMETSP0009_2-20130614/4289_1 /TAXON_ID=210454 /ORGANISM="Grammatophora oceanica, Strain CCMP 410" /LENGTH=85 /DNA_ID=CAMNT_0038671049 /DNA_START=131 /DNA_END=388 /DNA_ORIENTATION=+
MALDEKTMYALTAGAVGVTVGAIGMNLAMSAKKEEMTHKEAIRVMRRHHSIAAETKEMVPVFGQSVIQKALLDAQQSGKSAKQES